MVSDNIALIALWVKLAREMRLPGPYSGNPFRKILKGAMGAVLVLLIIAAIFISTIVITITVDDPFPFHEPFQYQPTGM